jgi:YesN/AraC family two-component response regulator
MGMDSKSILIVEDEAILAMEYIIIVREMGYNVTRIAFNGQDAIWLSGQYRPDVVLMDITLAGTMDGIDAAQVIQAQFDIPVVFITGNSDRDTQERASGIKPAGYLQKPLNENKLKTTLDNILNIDSSGSLLQRMDNN